jgi:hypothetical protein
MADTAESFTGPADELAVDYEAMPIDQLAGQVEELATNRANLLPMIEIRFEAEARLPKIPKESGVFHTQRDQLESIIATTTHIIDESKLSDEALRLKPDKTGY